jgi:hypothetical protein
VKHFTTFLIYNAAFYHLTYKSDRLSRQPWVLFVTQTKRRGIPRISARKRTRSECMSCNNDAARIYQPKLALAPQIESAVSVATIHFGGTP